ncbi:hypothetical protein BH23CHL1_BH23CHL1_08110 [soil metagenome]
MAHRIKYGIVERDLTYLAYVEVRWCQARLCSMAKRVAAVREETPSLV